MATSDVSWVLRFEGVNFTATLLDTNDISTIRGAGLALLDAVRDVEATLGRCGLKCLSPIFAGASQAAFRFSADEKTAEAALKAVRAALAERATPPLRHLMFVTDIVRLAGDVEVALHIAEARNRGRQYREFTVNLPDTEAKSRGPDPFDHVSQALKPFRMADGLERPYSPSVIARHEYGRDQRDRFYEQRADGKPLAVCRCLQEIVDAPPHGLPVSPQGKVAYLYGDGNRFGTIRGKVGTEVFARELAERQASLLRQITSWLRKGLAEKDPSRMALIETSPGKKTGLARFETLLWGGDEFLFVMPAWLGLHFLGQVAAAMAAWQPICGHDLTFAFGLAICDVKTPVRQAREAAHRLAESVKDAMGDTPRSGAAIQVYESQSLIDAPLKTQRGLLFGVLPRETEGLDKMLTISSEALRELPETIRSLTDEGAPEGGLSGAALHAAIMAARDAPCGLLKGDDAARDALVRAFGRFAKDVPQVHIPGFVTRGLVLDLCLVAMLRDYCALPEHGATPAFPAVTS